MTTALARSKSVAAMAFTPGFSASMRPQLSPTVSPSFADTKEGATAFIDWLKPQFPKGRWNPPPTQLCVVGMEPFADGKQPWVTQPIATSKGAFHILEPYGASFHYITPDEQAQGLKKRTLQQVLALCAKAPRPKWEPPPPPPKPKRL